MLDVFTVDIEDDSRHWDTSILSRAEEVRAESIIQPKKRQRWMRSHIALRERLAERIDKCPASLRFGHQNGKPFLIAGQSTSAPSFSIARSDRFLCIAICNESKIGIDIESDRPVKNRRQKSSQFFCDYEHRMVSALDEREADVAFLQIWTAKEAWLKAIGCGVRSFPVNEVCVERSPQLRYRHTRNYNENGWNLIPIEWSGLIGCVASRNEFPNISLHHHDSGA